MGSLLKILHIEDDRADALLIKELLKTPPAPIFDNITNVTRLSEALKELQDNDYNVVLLDLQLMDVSGLDNLRCIKEENPNIPIIVLTGSSDENLAKKSLLEGAQEFLFKGLTSPDILKRIIVSSIIRKSAENDLNEQLHYDQLTKVPNRLFFKKMSETLLNKAQRRNLTEGLLFIDLDGFKGVNDTYGHEAGNITLSITAERIKSALRSSDVVARYAGDEFVIYLDGKDTGITADDCTHIAKKIIQHIEEPIKYQGSLINISASIGISMFPYHGLDYSTLMAAADQAMYLAKKQTYERYCFATMPEDKNDMPEHNTRLSNGSHDDKA